MIGPDLLDAFGLLRVEELRADLRHELEEACRWKVTVCAPPCMAVQVGPHQVDVPLSWPSAGRVDAVVVAFDIDSARVLPMVLAGAPDRNCPQPPALVATGFSLRFPIAYVNVHAATIAIRQHNISEVPHGRHR